MKKRFAAKLQEVKAELRQRMHDNLIVQGHWLKSVVRGYFRYQAIPGNWEAIGAFRTQVARLWYRTLRRRSQKNCITWERMERIVKAWLPAARILHPWPDQRFDATIRGKGASGNNCSNFLTGRYMLCGPREGHPGEVRALGGNIG